VLALAWIGLLVLVGWLVWDQTRFLQVNDMGIDFRFDIVADTRAEQILATIVLAALAIPPLGMLMTLGMGVRGRNRRVRETAETRGAVAGASGERVARIEEHVEDLERRLANERRSGVDDERISRIESQVEDIRRTQNREHELVRSNNR
jgi:hypothetical protein